MLKTSKKDQEGFTLIEVLISVTLLSLMMVYVFTTIESSIDTKESITAEDDDYMQIETVFSRIQIDFSQIYSPSFFEAPYKKQQENNDNPYDESKKFIPTDRFKSITDGLKPIPILDNPEKSSLIFFTASNRRKVQDSKQSNYGWVEYGTRSSTLEDDNRKRPNGNLEIYRSFEVDNIYSESFNWGKLNSYVLLRHVKSFKFFFWDEVKEDWVERLRERARPKTPVRLIKVVINWIDRNGNELEFERSFRTLWTYFDVEKDQKERWKALNATNK
ncbi:MAG: type II secretion system GspH family protein [Bdellovibrionales bacterium]|jgi:prepilin-type N-terminal cleavage/methylation domain-containing protein|nr:type II secretion system GspH family protein [Bdellovibrionales bacterium]